MSSSPVTNHAALSSSIVTSETPVVVHLDPVIAALPMAFLSDTGDDRTLAEFVETLIVRFFNDDDGA